MKPLGRRSPRRSWGVPRPCFIPAAPRHPGQSEACGPQATSLLVSHNRPSRPWTASAAEAASPRPQGGSSPRARHGRVLSPPQLVLRRIRQVGPRSVGRAPVVGYREPVRWCLLREDARWNVPVPGPVPQEDPSSLTGRHRRPNRGCPCPRVQTSRPRPLLPTQPRRSTESAPRTFTALRRSPHQQIRSATKQLHGDDMLEYRANHWS